MRIIVTELRPQKRDVALNSGFAVVDAGGSVWALFAVMSPGSPSGRESAEKEAKDYIVSKAGTEDSAVLRIVEYTA